jgi:hypothetical protein
MLAYPDSHCVFGYMTICSDCLGPNVPAHVDQENPIKNPPAAGKRQRCEMCGKMHRLMNPTPDAGSKDQVPKKQEEQLKIWISLRKRQGPPALWCLDRRTREVGGFIGCSGSFNKPNHEQLQLEIRVMQESKTCTYIFDPGVLEEVLKP